MQLDFNHLCFSSSLFGNIQEIFRFQQQFLRTLEEAVEAETQFNVLDSAKQFKVMILVTTAHLGDSGKWETT